MDLLKTEKKRSKKSFFGTLVFLGKLGLVGVVVFLGTKKAYSTYQNYQNGFPPGNPVPIADLANREQQISTLNLVETADEGGPIFNYKIPSTIIGDQTYNVIRIKRPFEISGLTLGSLKRLVTPQAITNDENLPLDRHTYAQTILKKFLPVGLQRITQDFINKIETAESVYVMPNGLTTEQKAQFIKLKKQIRLNQFYYFHISKGFEDLLNIEIKEPSETSYYSEEYENELIDYFHHQAKLECYNKEENRIFKLLNRDFNKIYSFYPDGTPLDLNLIFLCNINTIYKAALSNYDEFAASQSCTWHLSRRFRRVFVSGAALVSSYLSVCRK